MIRPFLLALALILLPWRVEAGSDNRRDISDWIDTRVAESLLFNRDWMIDSIVFYMAWIRDGDTSWWPCNTADKDLWEKWTRHMDTVGQEILARWQDGMDPVPFVRASKEAK